MTEIKEMDYAELERRSTTQRPIKGVFTSTPTVSEAEASRLFHAFNPAGNNQIEKAHFLKHQGTITGRFKATPNIKEKYETD